MKTKRRFRVDWVLMPSNWSIGIFGGFADIGPLEIVDRGFIKNDPFRAALESLRVTADGWHYSGDELAALVMQRTSEALGVPCECHFSDTNNPHTHKKE